jgi:hypothetical protein
MRRDHAYEPFVDGEHAVQRKSGLFGGQLRGAGVLYRLKLDCLSFSCPGAEHQYEEYSRFRTDTMARRSTAIHRFWESGAVHDV